MGDDSEWEKKLSPFWTRKQLFIILCWPAFFIFLILQNDLLVSKTYITLNKIDFSYLALFTHRIL